MLKTLLLHAVILCATQTSGVYIVSEPPGDRGLIRATLNDTLSLLCSGEPGESNDAELVWLRNGARVRLDEGNRHGNSSICVTPVTYEDNAAVFTCEQGDSSPPMASVTLYITYAPLPSEGEKEEVVVEEKEALVLQCDMRANPPLTPSWLYNESLLAQSTGSGIVVTNDGINSRLTVAKADRDLHGGTYQCLTNTTVHRTFVVTVTETTPKFPLMPMVAGIVVVVLTTLLAVVSRRKKIAKLCCK